MAKVTKKDSDTYLKEKESFLRDLQHFHESKGTPCRHGPKIGGKEIDLYLLYSLVTSNGGWVKVNSRNQWNSLLAEFNLPKNCVNVSVALKQIYLRYLDKYEKAHFLGETHNAMEDDDDGGGRHKRWSNVRSTQPSVPLAYNHSQHQITDTVRASSALSKDLYSASEYDKLALSLLCPLPNEQDFALNVCTLLSNEFRAAHGQPTGIRLSRHTRLLRYLLAHTGVFADDTLRSYFTDNYRSVRWQSLETFWEDIVEDRSILRMMREMIEQDSRLVDETEHLRRLRARERRRMGVSRGEVRVGGASTARGEKGEPVSIEATEKGEGGVCEENKGVKGEMDVDSESTTSKEKTESPPSEGGKEPVDSKIESADESSKQKEGSKEVVLLEKSIVLLEDSKEGKGGEISRVEKQVSPLLEPSEETSSSLVTEQTNDTEFLSDDDELEGGQRSGKRLRLRIRPEDRLLFALGRGLGCRESVGQRVLQIATVLRNFTFNEENNALLSRDLTFLRFMILCCSSNWSCLRQLGLDMFSNIASEITMDETLAPVLFDIISRGLSSEDRAQVLSSIEILNKLGQVEKNEDVLLRSLQQKVYNQVCTLLTLHDIMLLIHTLECVYSLSSLGERACNAIMRVHGAMDVLVSLVTVEAQSFGPKACILMRVVETIDPNSSSEDVPDNSPSTLTPLISNPGPPTGLNAPTFTLPMALAPVAVPVPLSQAVTPLSSNTTAPMTPMVRHRPPTAPRTSVVATSQQVMHPRQTYRVITPNKVMVSGTSTPGVSSSSGVATPNIPGLRPQTPSGQNTRPQTPGGVHTRPQTTSSRPPEENGEMFATQWLRQNFEHASLPGRAIEQAELYKQYINAASRAGRKGVIAPLHFPRVVRSVFGAQIGPKQVIPAAPPGSTAPPPPPIHVYEGIQVRGKQPIITQTIAIAPSPQQHTLHHQHQTLAAHQQTISQQQQQQAVSTSQQNSLLQSQSQQINPMSPILKAQLSAPPKPQTSTATAATAPVCSNTARTKAHPHLSQALLGAGGTPTSTVTTPSTPAAVGGSTDPNSSTSLIKSLLANKVGPDSSAVATASVSCSSTQPASPLVVNSSVASQVTQRQQQAQKMMSQSTGASNAGAAGSVVKTGQQMRVNGVTINMQHVIENSLDSKPAATESPSLSTSLSVTSTSALSSDASQPPPLAPLSNTGTPTSCNASPGSKGESKEEGVSSVVVNGGISNSILQSDSSEQYKENIAKQSLMLVDLLEKSISDKDPPIMNGAIRIGEKGLDLFTSIDTKSKLPAQSTTTCNVNIANSPSVGVIRRVSGETISNGTTAPLNGSEQQVSGLKRSRPLDSQDSSEAPAVKKLHVNGDVNPTSSNVDEEPEDNNVKASSTAANLYAALAADVLEDEELLAEAPQPPAHLPPTPQSTQVITTHTVPVQNNTGSPQGQVIVTGGGNGRQILVTGGPGGVLPQRLQMMGQHYVVTQQPQLVQGHSGQTVLVAQTSQQAGGPSSKTIIILQPSSSSSSLPSSSKTIVTSMPASTLTTSTNSNNKVTPHATVVHRTPQAIRPQPSGTPTPSSSATVIKPVPDTRPRGSLAQQSGFQAQFVQQQQKLMQQQTMVQQPQQQTIGQQSQQTVVQQPQQTQQSIQQIQPPASGQFICEWRGCMRNFKSANEVYMHACEAHCPVNPAAEIQCLWERCDVLRRKRFSHMTHLYDRHCNPDVLKMMAVRRKQLSSNGKTEIPPPPAPSPHPGYAPNAAFNAIKRHALEFVNPKELQDDNEGPVTKSIRLTSSLILRNLVIYSTTGRRHLVSYEPHLASVALSNVESSKTIAQVLFDMNDTQSAR